MVEVMTCVRSKLSDLWRSACSSRLLISEYNKASCCRSNVRAYSRSGRDASDAPHGSTTAYYDILRVSPHATQAQIKTAYYKQAFIYHPDRNRGEEAARRFALIAEAYSVLGSVALRRRYDSGALTPADAQDAWRPPSSSPPPHQRQGSRRASQSSTNTRFDFDAHYQAHYGDELQREKQTRDKQEEMQQHQREDFTRWKLRKVTEVTVGLLLLSAALLLFNLTS